METIGAVLAHVAPGEVDIELPFRDSVTQQHGYVHGGIVTAIADSACEYAALTLLPAGAEVLTVEYNSRHGARMSGPSHKEFVSQRVQEEIPHRDPDRSGGEFPSKPEGVRYLGRGKATGKDVDLGHHAFSLVDVDRPPPARRLTGVPVGSLRRWRARDYRHPICSSPR